MITIARQIVSTSAAPGSVLVNVTTAVPSRSVELPTVGAAFERYGLSGPHRPTDSIVRVHVPIERSVACAPRRVAAHTGSPPSMGDKELEHSAIKQCDSYLCKCPPQIYIDYHHE